MTNTPPTTGTAVDTNPSVADERALRIRDAARRALAEAEARRKAMDALANAMPSEVDGRGGLDPVRYGDWEIKGRTVDF